LSEPQTTMNNLKPNFIHLPYDLHACYLGDAIAIMQVTAGYPIRGKWISLDSADPKSWHKRLHGQFKGLKSDEENEILAAINADFAGMQAHTFKSGRTKITLVPSPFKEHEVYVFDHTRQTWVAFNWDTQWYDLKQLGLGCKPITIQREAHKAFDWMELFFNHRNF